jgi:hypothetical protein
MYNNYRNRETRKFIEEQRLVEQKVEKNKDSESL